MARRATLITMLTEYSPRSGLSGAQSRMARAALGVGLRDVARAAKVSPTTISRLENGETLHPRTVAVIRHVFEAAGCQFIGGASSDSVGVILHPPGTPAPAA